MTTGNDDWRLRRVEEMLMKLDVWERWHEKQLIRGLAEVIAPMVGSMATARVEADRYIRQTIPQLWGSIDYSECQSPEDFKVLVDRWSAGLQKEVAPIAKRLGNT